MIKLLVKDTDRLKSEIALSGYTVTELANRIGIGNNYLSSIIHQNNNPSPKLAKAIVNSINDQLGTEYRIGDIFFAESVEKLQH